MVPAVDLRHIHYQYSGQEKPSLNDLSLKIFKGEKFGLFGPNGAGKTTLMQVMTGLINPSKGETSIMGMSFANQKRDIHQVIGFVPQDFSFYHELSPLENLAFFGAWYGMSTLSIKTKSAELLEILGLSSVGNKQVQKFSGGMKRRVNLAIGVMHDPQILFLDEPTVGVDVQTRNAIVQYLNKLNQQGTTLVYTSHQLKEAEELCDRVAMIDEGEIIALDTLQALMDKHQQEGLEGLFLTLTGMSYRDA